MRVMRHPLSAHRDSRIMGDAWKWITDPLDDWSRENRSMSALAWALVQTDPYAAAMLQARLIVTHGSNGLRFRSTYREQGDDRDGKSERLMQRQLTELIAESWHSTDLDAGRQLTRDELELNYLISA